jgi:sporulation protein YlmC with PRC-barrel domain
MTRGEDVRLEDLLGREVHDLRHKRVGRLEEIRAQKDGEIVAYALGAAGLFERLGLGAMMLVGKRGHGRLARRDQLDVTDPRHPVLTCALEDLEQI